MTEKTYISDLLPDEEIDTFMPFTVYLLEGGQFQVSTDLGSEERDTLDEALFWALILGGRHITETLRKKVLLEWGEPQ